MSARYEVCSINRWNLATRTPRQTVWIADSWYGFAVVESYRETQTMHPVTCAQRAQHRCAELNAEHDAWMRDNGYAASVHRSVDTVDRP